MSEAGRHVVLAPHPEDESPPPALSPPPRIQPVPEAGGHAVLAPHPDGYVIIDPAGGRRQSNLIVRQCGAHQHHLRSHHVIMCGARL